jgi:hypothetical protein
MKLTGATRESFLCYASRRRSSEHTKRYVLLRAPAALNTECTTGCSAAVHVMGFLCFHTTW